MATCLASERPGGEHPVVSAQTYEASALMWLAGVRVSAGDWAAVVLELATALRPDTLWVVDRSSQTMVDPVSGDVRPVAALGPASGDAAGAHPICDDRGELRGVLVAAQAPDPAVLEVVAARLADLDALVEARERVEQLSALNAAAHQVSAQLELDEVLATVCARARALTGAEIAYIMLLDPVRGDCYIRASEGVQTEPFRSVRLGIGEGMGGLVAKEARPYYSSDYATDPRFEHVIDGAVAGEGVVSVMGVPLLVEGAVTGILFAAYRRRMTFSEADSAFLESLGEHAAIALTNARLHGQTEDTLARERELHQLAEEQRADLHRAAQLHDRLSELMVADLAFDDLLSAVGQVLGSPVMLSPVLPTGPSAPVAAGREHLGWLCPATADLPVSDHRALEQAARVVAAHLLKERAVLHAEYRGRSELLDALLVPAEQRPADASRRARHFGVDLDKPLAVAWVTSAAPAHVLNEAVAQACARQAEASLVSARDGGVLAVSTAREPRAWAERIAKQLPADLLAVLGLALRGAALDDLPAAVEEARAAADAGRATGRPAGAIVTQDELGINPLLLRNSDALRSYAERLLRPLLDYDRDHGIDLLDTLDAYLRMGGRRVQAAEHLNLHPNSLYYRLRRIREILAVDLDDAGAVFEITLALRVHRAYGGR